MTIEKRNEWYHLRTKLKWIIFDNNKYIAAHLNFCDHIEEEKIAAKRLFTERARGVINSINEELVDLEE